jgi:mannosyltransferase
VNLIALCLPWLVVPAILLLLGSLLVTPMYTFRYFMFSVPAGALLGGAALVGIANIPRHKVIGLAAAAAVFALFASLGVGQQVLFRKPWGHGDDIGTADKLIAAQWRPGDAVFYRNSESMTWGVAYPDGFGRLIMVQTNRAAIPSNTLGGTTVDVNVLRHRLPHIRRLWIVEVGGDKDQWRVLEGMPFRLAAIWHTHDIFLDLYVPSRSPYWGDARFASLAQGSGPWNMRHRS